MYCFGDNLFKFFFTLLFLFPTNILIVHYSDCLRSPHARHKESFLCVARLRTEWGEQKCGTPQSLAKWCATLAGSGDHRIAREVV